MGERSQLLRPPSRDGRLDVALAPWRDQHVGRLPQVQGFWHHDVVRLRDHARRGTRGELHAQMTGSAGFRSGGPPSSPLPTQSRLQRRERRGAQAVRAAQQALLGDADVVPAGQH